MRGRNKTWFLTEWTVFSLLFSFLQLARFFSELFFEDYEWCSVWTISFDKVLLFPLKFPFSDTRAEIVVFAVPMITEARLNSYLEWQAVCFPSACVHMFQHLLSFCEIFQLSASCWWFEKRRKWNKAKFIFRLAKWPSGYRMDYWNVSACWTHGT